MSTANYGFIAGELTTERHARASQANERMKPQSAQRKLIKQTNQVIAPSCVRQFVDEDGIEFSLIEGPLNTGGKQDTGFQNAAYCGARMSVVEAHRNTMRHKAGRNPKVGPPRPNWSFTTLPAYA
jgi:hypothetical protein